jgi:hypothetical protein
MKTTGLVRAAAALAALAMCPACDGGAGTPANATTPFTASGPDQAARSKPKQFVYIINNYGSYASIFDYPASTKQIGTISNVGGQGCTNVQYGIGKKTFWIVAGADQITEYEVPHKPIKTLSISSGQPSSCAMNKQGDLAVGNLRNGEMILFKNASGTGTVIPTDLAQELFDGYDNKGNLFFDGISKLSQFKLYEIANGSSNIQSIATSNVIHYPGSVQWDGKYLTVLDQESNVIYRYAIEGTTATLKGSVTLNGAGDCTQTWIAIGIVFCADAGNDNGVVYAYPAGGSPIAVLSGNFDLPLGVVAVQK